MKPKVAIVRGKFLNAYEMQIFEPLTKDYKLTAFGSLTSYHSSFSFPTVKLLSPMDLPDFPYKMQLINRLFVDAHVLFMLEKELAGFDLVHSAETYYSYTQQALRAKREGRVKKVIATVLENIPFNNEGIHGRKEFKQRARKELDHIIALTERTKASLILEGADEKKITVISHGIDTKRFSPKKKKQSNDINLLFCGRLEKYKGVYEILYAFRRLLDDPALQKFSLSLTMVGDGSEKEKLEDMKKWLHIEQFVTNRQLPYSEIPKAYQDADIYLAPSKSSQYWIEQYNTSLLEAQASGLSIVTTLSGGIPENVSDAAMLVQPDDFYALSEAVKQLILSPQLRIHYAEKARKRALSVHDSHVIANKIAKVYEKVLRQ